MSFERHDIDGLLVLRCPALKSRHGFSTRRGGISQAPFDGLNLSTSSGDAPEVVAANRARFLAAVGLRGPLSVAHQVHGATVAEPPVARGTQADVLVTDRPEAPIGVFVADCVPILIEDQRSGAVAAVHAGWRGTAERAVVAAVEALRTRFGARPGELVAAIGPSIGGCCYQVGPEVVEAIGRVADPATALHQEAQGWKADLSEANRQQLRGCGVEAVHLSGLCTACHPELLYSYRREGPRSGRMLAVIERRA